VFLSGTLSFAADRDTRLDTGLIRIGGGLMEDGANMTGHEASSAALEAGTSARPIPRQHAVDD
jgi:hypothetical protein